jgi:XTP/dITP diphosphohydrolase
VKKIILATQNAHKLEELRSVLPDGWEVHTAIDAGICGELPETGTTLEENATQKARYLWEHCGIPSLADDSGLEVAVLNGEPGVYSAMYAGSDRSDQANRSLLLANLDGVADRSATFRTVLAWATPEGIQLFEGLVHGKIAHEERGAYGFGYDRIFVPTDGDGRTFAEMLPEEKVAMSHRSRAVRAWLTGLERS